MEPTFCDVSKKKKPMSLSSDTAVVRTENGDSELGEIRRGVRQGRLLSPLLF